jgi:hypothetical protein
LDTFHTPITQAHINEFLAWVPWPKDVVETLLFGADIDTLSFIHRDADRG